MLTKNKAFRTKIEIICAESLLASGQQFKEKHKRTKIAPASSHTEQSPLYR